MTRLFLFKANKQQQQQIKKQLVKHWRHLVNS